MARNDYIRTQREQQYITRLTDESKYLVNLQIDSVLSVKNAQRI